MRCASCAWARSMTRIAFSPTSTSDRKSTRLNSSHSQISYAVFCLKKKKTHFSAGLPATRIPHHTRHDHGGRRLHASHRPHRLPHHTVPPRLAPHHHLADVL